MIEFITAILIGGFAGWMGTEIFDNNKRWSYLHILIGVAGSIAGLLLYIELGGNTNPGFVKSLCSGAGGAILAIELLNFFYYRQHQDTL